MDFADFILQHQADDPATLALSRPKYADFPEFSLALSTLEARRKLRGKVPEWLDLPSLHFPYPLGAEQCSSSETAKYKAMQIWEEVYPQCESQGAIRRPGRSVTFVSKSWKGLEAGRGLGAGPQYISEGGHRFQRAHLLPDEICIADLTGGLGVDCWAFAKAGFKVMYNDMRKELVEAARHNFAELGVDGIEFRCAEVKPGGIDGILGSFKADAFFLDPARRDSSGGKVFRIADCSPDVSALLPELFRHARFVLIKLSPMLDITQGARDLGDTVKEIHVVGADGECKELLYLLDREHNGEYSITVYDNGSTLTFQPAEERDATAHMGSGPKTGVNGPEVGKYQGFRPENPAKRAGDKPGEPQGYLFEPGKALLKAGCFKLISQRFKIAKAGINTHLYFAKEPLQELSPFGKWFRILETCHLDKRGIRAIGTKYPQADVTARGVPLTSDELKKRLGVQSGSSGVHIFAAHSDIKGENLLIVSSAVRFPQETCL